MKQLLFSLFLSLIVIAGYGRDDNRLESTKAALDQLYAGFNGSPESIGKLIDLGKEGISLSPSDKHDYRLQFYLAMGTGYYYQQNFSQAKVNFELATKEALAAKIIEQAVKPLGNLVSIYYYLGEKELADSAAKELKAMLDKNDTLKNKGDIYYNLGLYNHQQKFYYSIALDYFLKSLELHKPIVDTTHIPKLKIDYGVKAMMVAEIYLYLKQPDKTIEYLNIAKPYLELSQILTIAVYGKYIKSYVLLNDKANALKYYNLLQIKGQESTGNWSELVSSNIQLAELYEKENNFKIARNYLEKADIQAKKDNKEILTSSVNLSWGDFYKLQKDYSKALQYYNLSQKGSAAYNKEQYAGYLKSITEVKLFTESPAETYISFQQYIAASDSLTKEMIALNIAEMEAIYQNKSKQQLIETQSEIITYSQKEKLGLIAGLILLLFIALLIYNTYRNKKKVADLLNSKNETLNELNKKLETANATKAKLFGIISHDLRSPISQVNHFLQLQQMNAPLITEEQKKAIQEKVKGATVQLLETMEDLLVWSKTQMDVFKVNKQDIHLNPLINNNILLLELKALDKNITINNVIPGDIKVKTDPDYLNTIIRNLLQNALNASPDSTTINIGYNYESFFHKIIIKNSGRSFSQSDFENAISDTSHSLSNSSLGLRIIHEMAGKIGISIHYVDSSVQETIVELKIPE
ncbi:tetratricopeptide repeat-containing sensor histidine kinase [Polluticaenibacter yanchengensis]|uniref:histidine kinase n=1 Tax=Polluticaenibacter yanchengensis TaxID=3014562 RepID=A0ABT4UK62_9BACT|nr:hypothetical protein [Chitinophagaceae bacterium LY-5]